MAGTAEEEACHQHAAEQQWQFEVRQGEWSLLRKLFHGDWDSDVVIVPPGGTIVARNDREVLDFEPAPATGEAKGTEGPEEG